MIRSLAKQRLRRFRAASSGERAAMSLYVLDSELAAHLHAAVRLAEVTLREGIHRALAAHYGDDWFELRHDLLDASGRRAFDRAALISGLRAPPGKIIANVMLGTWVNLLGAGENREDGSSVSYARVLWEPALKSVFPLPRREIARIAQRVNWARNRISHCEPVVFGFPMPGLGDGTAQVRRSPGLILEDVRALVSAVAPNLAPWLARWHETEELLASPLLIDALDYISRDPGVRLER